MTKTIRIEKRKRGIFGKIFSMLFWAFNLLMVAWLVLGTQAAIDQSAKLTSSAEQAGAAIGTTLGISMIMGFWVMGAIILGLLSFMTRGSKIITETKVE